jgi:hypothetical protein
MNKDIWYAAGAVALLAILHTAVGHAQEQFIEPQVQRKPVNCFPLMYTLEGLAEQEMNVLWQAKNTDDQWQNNIVLFTHDETNAWVMLEINDDFACVLGSGSKFFLLGNRYGKGEGT